eukprot:17019_1
MALQAISFIVDSNINPYEIREGYSMINGNDLHIYNSKEGFSSTFNLDTLRSCDAMESILGYRYSLKLSFQSQATNGCTNVDIYTNDQSWYKRTYQRFTDYLDPIKQEPKPYYKLLKNDDLNECEDFESKEKQSIDNTSMCIAQLACNGLCQRKYAPRALFFCHHNDCKHVPKLLCAECGVFGHKISKKSHTFDTNKDHIICVADLLEPNTDEFQDGVDTATKLKRFDSIQKVLFRQKWFVDTAAFALQSLSCVATNTIVNGAPILTACADGLGHVVPSALAVSVIGAGVGVVVASTVELAYIGYQLFQQRITKQEALLMGFAAVTANVASAGTFYGTMVLGAKIGGAVGTSGGLIGCIVGAIIGAIVTGIGVRYFINNKCGKWIENTYSSQLKLQQDALECFFGDENYDINDENKFNEKVVRRTYHKMAVHCHPDMKDGDHEEWLKLSSFYGVLIGIIEQQEEAKADKHSEENTLTTPLLDRPCVNI